MQRDAAASPLQRLFTWTFLNVRTSFTSITSPNPPGSIPRYPTRLFPPLPISSHLRCRYTSCLRHEPPGRLPERLPPQYIPHRNAQSCAAFTKTSGSGFGRSTRFPSTITSNLESKPSFLRSSVRFCWLTPELSDIPYSFNFSRNSGMPGKISDPSMDSIISR